MAYARLDDPPPAAAGLSPRADVIDRRPVRAPTAPRIAALARLGGILLALLAPPTGAIAADAQDLVEALRTVAGSRPGVRPTFAKGQCVRGTYTPAAEVGQVTRSISFTRPWPLVGRFSVGGGNPSVPDATRTVLRGFSIKLLSDGGETHLLFENTPVHFARTVDQMLAFLQVRVPGPDGKPNPEAIAAFAKANPETTRQAAFVAGKPVPGSYAGLVYWGVHTFTGLNADGRAVPFKFKIVPRAGEITLSDAEATGTRAIRRAASPARDRTRSRSMCCPSASPVRACSLKAARMAVTRAGPAPFAASASARVSPRLSTTSRVSVRLRPEAGWVSARSVMFSGTTRTSIAWNGSRPVSAPAAVAAASAGAATRICESSRCGASGTAIRGPVSRASSDCLSTRAVTSSSLRPGASSGTGVPASAERVIVTVVPDGSSTGSSATGATSPSAASWRVGSKGGICPSTASPEDRLVTSRTKGWVRMISRAPTWWVTGAENSSRSEATSWRRTRRSPRCPTTPCPSATWAGPWRNVGLAGARSLSTDMRSAAPMRAAPQVAIRQLAQSQRRFSRRRSSGVVTPWVGAATGLSDRDLRRMGSSPRGARPPSSIRSPHAQARRFGGECGLNEAATCAWRDARPLKKRTCRAR
ncbi:catalase [Methylobacterium sp. NPDC080182]|uniref:catalase n=1 Tax=Methylobacterium sp. NPDC080182 TaxID=3390590 RepID=UPI003CFF96FD